MYRFSALGISSHKVQVRDRGREAKYDMTAIMMTLWVVLDMFSADEAPLMCDFYLPCTQYLD